MFKHTYKGKEMSGLEHMKARLNAAGGTYNGRNTKGKLKSFHDALKNSYQAEIITIDDDENNIRQCECLINPSRLTEQFDKKVISIDFSSGMKEGTTFLWNRTNEHWIVNLRQHTEEAYFRGTISRCDYQTELNGKRYWVYLRGPVETDISWSQKHSLYFNNLNYSMVMHIAKNKETLDYFSRFQIVKICFTYKEGEETKEEWHRWQVAATDKYSNDNIIEVYLKEYADNKVEDEMIQPEETQFEPEDIYIDGPQIINAYDENISYTIRNLTGGQFVVSSSKVKIVKTDNDSITLDVLTGKAANIDIIYRKEGQDDIVLPIVIKSL